MIMFELSVVECIQHAYRESAKTDLSELWLNATKTPTFDPCSKLVHPLKSQIHNHNAEE